MIEDWRLRDIQAGTLAKENVYAEGQRKPYRLEIELAGTPAATNRQLGKHWATLKRYRDGWKNMVAWAVKGKEPPKPLKRARLTLTRYNYRTLDYDGLVASFKPVVDALKYAGVIQDDGWKHTGAWNVTQEYRPKGQDGVRVVVEELK